MDKEEEKTTTSPTTSTTSPTTPTYQERSIEQERETQKNTKKTVKDDRSVVKQSFTMSPFVNDEGETDERATADFQNNYVRPLQDQYEIDPASGRYKGDIGTLLGFNPEKYKEELKQRQRLAAFKRKEAGWRNALGVVIDGITAAIGGDVHKREADDTAANAKEEEDKIQDTVRQLGIALNDARKGQEAAYAKARAERLDQYIKDYGRKIEQTIEQGGGETVTDDKDATTTKSKNSGTQGHKTTEVRYTYGGDYKSGSGRSSGGGGGPAGSRSKYTSAVYMRPTKDENDQLTYEAVYYDLDQNALNAGRGVMSEMLRRMDNPKVSEKEKALYKSIFEKAGVANVYNLRSGKSISDEQVGAFLNLSGYANDPDAGWLRGEINKIYEYATGEKVKEHTYIDELNEAVNKAAGQGGGGNTDDNDIPTGV